jgi:glycerol-1-phosphate dehydrogenase [NAD(P)+]
MDFPEVFFFGDSDDEDRAAQELAAYLDSLGIEEPFVLTSTHGRRLGAAIAAIGRVEVSGQGADQQWAADFGSRSYRAGADAIVAIGGGRTLDLGKHAAARAGLTLVVVPTQLSHDGICSPVAVVPNATGRTESLGAIEPRAAFISLPTIAKAPPESIRAGLGDLLANPLALRDWALAAEHGLEDIEQRAWDMSVQSFGLIEDWLDQDPAISVRDPEFLRKLSDALVMSGTAMICSGTSRPASGGEHEISHALDELYGGRAMHGEQVAFGCIVSVALYDDDIEAFKKRLVILGLPHEPSALGLSTQDLTDVLLAAPNTRPGRFTILEEADLNRDKARKLIERIWD